MAKKRTVRKKASMSKTARKKSAAKAWATRRRRYGKNGVRG